MADPGLHLDELFVSLQGEGAELGRVHAFLRLGGCPLRCRYCDTPRSWRRRGVCEVHRRGGIERRDNPLPGAEALDLLAELCRERGLDPASVPLAVTGGEPLEQAEALAAVLPRWPGPRLLETAGVLPEALARLLPHLDLVSLDWKLPSTLSAGEDLLAPAACLALARAQPLLGLWVKVVVLADTPDAELRAALERLAARAPGVRVHLQPATPTPRGPEPPAAERLLDLAAAAADLDLDLRVVPQLHPVLGVR